MTWKELLEKEDKTETEQIVIQCITTLCSHLVFQGKTPEDIYKLMKELCS